MAIARSNNAISWPVFAALVKSQNTSKLIFYDFENNKLTPYYRDSYSMNSVSSYGSDGGKFLFTSTKNSEKYALYYYDYYQDIEKKIFEYDGILNAPFRISDTYCALSPNSKTKKQNYNYYLICNGVNTKIRLFDYYSYYNQNGENAIFVDKVGFGSSVYKVFEESGVIKYTKTNIPFFSNIFSIISNDNGLFMINRGTSSISVYNFVNEEVILLKKYEKLEYPCPELDNYIKIISLDIEKIVGSRVNDEKNGFEFFICRLDKFAKSDRIQMKIE